MEDDYATADESSNTNIGFKGLLKQFISTFERSPLLWDKEHNDYRNRYKRQKALVKLAEILRKIKPGAGVEDVKKKINSLRSNYRKELQKIMYSQEAGSGEWREIYKPRSWVFYELTFLGNVGSAHPQPLVKRKSEATSETEDDQDHANSMDKEDYQASSSEDSTPHRSLSTESKRKKAKTKQIDPHDNIVGETSTYGLRSDDNIHQATVWAKKLTNLDPLQRIYTEKAINDILFEAELGNLTRESVTRVGNNNASGTIIVAKREGEIISRL